RLDMLVRPARPLRHVLGVTQQLAIKRDIGLLDALGVLLFQEFALAGLALAKRLGAAAVHEERHRPQRGAQQQQEIHDQEQADGPHQSSPRSMYPSPQRVRMSGGSKPLSILVRR